MAQESTNYETVSSETNLFRVGLMGAPGSGKTTSALTFPGVRLLTKDNKQPPGTAIVPFYDKTIEKALSDKYGAEISRSGPRSGLINFLVKESIKRVGPQYTEVMDSWTAWFNDFETWADLLGKNTTVFHTKGKGDKGPELDNFKIHDERLAMAVEIMAAFRALKCHSIICIHEAIKRNVEQVEIGVRPLCKGQFQDQFTQHVTCFFRQKRLFDKENDKEHFVWQVKADSEFYPILPPGFDTDRVQLLGKDKKYMKADYATLMQAMGTPV